MELRVSVINALASDTVTERSVGRNTRMVRLVPFLKLLMSAASLSLNDKRTPGYA